MKLNKALLKEMIRDALYEQEQKFTAGSDAATAGDVRRGAMASAKEQSMGLTDDERGLIKQLVGILTAAAKKTDLTSGMAAQKNNQLASILQKIAGEQGTSKEQPQDGESQ